MTNRYRITELPNYFGFEQSSHHCQTAVVALPCGPWLLLVTSSTVI